MQSYFAMLFAALIERGDLKLGIQIWNSLKSDDAQRTLLVATAHARIPPTMKSLMPPNMASRIAWAVTQANHLAAFRNDATHTPFMQKKIGARWKSVPEPYVGQPFRVKRLELIGPARLFRLLRGDLLQLGHYVGVLFSEAHVPGQFALPRKPRMQLHELWNRLAPSYISPSAAIGTPTARTLAEFPNRIGFLVRTDPGMRRSASAQRPAQRVLPSILSIE